ncbi:MAG: hypothetical protein IJ757_05115 [Clostridiales bacterium]|nr:hypothetical protein [Clostridiales bacterium]
MENENINNQGPVIDNNPSPASGNAKLFAILSYIGILWLLGLLIEPEKNDPFVKNHVNNGILLSIGCVICGIIPIIGWLCEIVLLVFAIMGIVAAAQGNQFSMPVVGDKIKIIK